MATISKSDFTKRISEKTGSSQKDAEKLVSAFLETIRDVLKEGNELKFVGFGAFSVQDVAERQGVNPKTREKITIGATKRVKFAAGKELSDAVLGEAAHA